MKRQNRFALPALVAVIGLSLLPVSARGESIILNPVADTSIFEKAPENNLGGTQSLAAGNTAAPDPARALLRFDVQAALPAGSRITGVFLELKVVRVSGLVEPATFDLHRMLVGWGEGDKGTGSVTGTGSAASAGEATWSSRFHLQQSWSAPGAAPGTDFVTAPSASAGITSGDQLSLGSDTLNADVQSWLDHAETNFGWLLKDHFESGATTARRFGSREHPTDRPRLQVQFEAPLRIHRAVLKDGKFCLSFTAHAKGYLIQSRNAVDAGEWQTVWMLPAADVPMEVEICDPAPVTGARFYRVVEM